MSDTSETQERQDDVIYALGMLHDAITHLLEYAKDGDDGYARVVDFDLAEVAQAIQRLDRQHA